MTRLLLFIFLLTPSSGKLPAQMLTPVDQGSRVHFTIKNFGIRTGGDFAGLAGEICFDTSALENSYFNVTVNAATIDTDNGVRDKSLREEYLETEKFPLIRLESSKIERTNKTSEGFYFFTGELTIKDSTHAISFPFKALKQSDGYLFTGGFDINRLDFGVGKRSNVLGTVITLSLSVFAKNN